MSDHPRHWRPWRLHDLGSTRPTPADKLAPARTKRNAEAEISRALFEQAKERACAQGFEQGREEGFKQGQREGFEAAQRAGLEGLDQRLDTLVAPLAELVRRFESALREENDTIARATTELALEVGRVLAGDALRLAPEYIVDDVQALLEEPFESNAPPTLLLHPEDLALVETRLDAELRAAGWQLRANPALERGDCQLESMYQVIDASRSDRWERLRLAVGHKAH